MAWLWSCLWLDRSAAKYVTSAPRHLYSSPHIQPPGRTRVSKTSILRPSGDFFPSRQLRQDCNSIIQEARKSRVCIVVCSSVWWLPEEPEAADRGGILAALLYYHSHSFSDYIFSWSGGKSIPSRIKLGRSIISRHPMRRLVCALHASWPSSTNGWDHR